MPTDTINNDSELDCYTDRELERAERYDSRGFVGSTLSGLFRAGDLTVSDKGHLVFIDLKVRRSGTVLYGSGDTLDDAIFDVWDQLYDHNNALDHLADLGVEPEDVGRLISSTGEYDSQAVPITAMTTFSTPAPVYAAAGEPVDGADDEPSEGTIFALLIPVVVGRA